MHDAFTVGPIERVGNLNRNAEQKVGLHWLSGDPVLERQPIQKLHHDEGLAILLPDFIDRADVGMVERRGRLCFPLEASQRLWVLGDFMGEKLNADKPAKS